MMQPDDLHNRGKAEEELIAARLKAELIGRNYENIFANSPAGIFVIDVNQDGEYFINASNPVHGKILGIPNNILAGKPLGIIKDIFDLNTYEYIKRLYDQIISTRETLIFEEKITVNNQQVWLSTTIRPIFDDSGRIHRLIGTNLDITALKNTENDLIAAKEKAEESDRLKTAFLQNISHEIRTPLNAIVGFSSLIAERMYEDQKLSDFSRIIANNSDKLISIIMDVVEISQIQTSRVKVHIEKIRLESLIEKVIRPFFERAENVKTRLSLSKNNITADTVIQSDPLKLERIIFHLLDNAVKFTLRGSINILFDFSDKYLKITVADTGIGIEESHQKYIFEPFRQVETGNLNYGGLGLGLSLVKAYAELLHGHSGLESATGNGTVVTVEIPVLAFDDNQNQDLILTNKDYPNNSLTGIQA